MQISNNIASYNVWKNYTNNVSALRSSMSKLSSGSRIGNAGDDASGLAMSERMRSQIRNTEAAANNVENKLNYLQT
ncbi:MAG: flagellin, partial [Pontiellaceae bacterium]|nr:flagellin [Pontiellaceae bacterium]